MMLSSLRPGCSSWLLVPMLAFAQGSCATVVILNPRAGGGGGGGDSDSDSDGESESCSNGVCTVCKKGVCTTSTQGSKSTGSRTATGTGSGTRTTALNTSSTGTNAAHTSGLTAGDAKSSNNTVAKKGLSKGGIAGLVVGLAIIAGLLVMLFLKRRAHLRHLAKRPRGATLLNHDRPSNTTSLYSGPDGSGSGSEMAESEFSPGVVSSAATAIAAANLAAIPANGYPAPQPYKRFNADADGPNTSSTSDASPFAQSKPSRSERQGALLVDIETQPSDGVLLSPLPLLPSPHEQSSFGLIDAAAASSSQALNRQSRDLPGLPASTTHADMVAFQKELERDDEKTNQPNGTRTAEDPPPLYSD